MKMYPGLNLTPHHEDVWEVEVQFHVCLASAQDEGEWLISRPDRFNPKEGAHGTIWIGYCVGPTAGLETRGKDNIPYPRSESNPVRPTPNLVTILTLTIDVSATKQHQGQSGVQTHKVR
jgi:hypothetical protein